MGRPRRLAIAAAALAAALLAAPAAAVAAAPDPVLESLVRQALERSPDVARAASLVAAERERVPQAGALGDPTLSLGLQNDGFKEIQIGKMDTSYWQVMVTQPLPWPGKRELRTEVARLGASQAEAALARTRLTLEADVRRGYLDLVLVRDRQGLLARLEGLWLKAEALARSRYENGEGAQSDLLRAQLERTRLRQRRLALDAEERTRLLALERLLAGPAGEPAPPIPAGVTVTSRGVPALLEDATALADAEARSPELAAARLVAERGQRVAALARRERFPDLAVTAAIMPRGAFEPMWSAGVSVSLPIFSGRKQGRATAEQEARAAAEGSAADGVRRLLRERVLERQALLRSLGQSLELYQGGLLTQSQATVESTLAQYRVGRVTFASVLEAVAGVVDDEDGYLATLAEAQRVGIAAAEVSLGAAGGGGGGLSGAPVPGAGSTGGGGGGAATAGAASGGGDAPAASSSSSSMSRM